MLRKWKLVWLLRYLQFVDAGKFMKNIWNLVFSDFKHVFLLFGGDVTKNAFSKMFLTFRYAFFDTNLILWQHPQQVFYDLKNQFLKICGKSIFFWFFWCFYTIPPSWMIWFVDQKWISTKIDFPLTLLNCGYKCEKALAATRVQGWIIYQCFGHRLTFASVAWSKMLTFKEEKNV